ncbi:tyrosine-protein phosphatase [Photobacterium makurazakiensis]|uniref:tyrosine-protein phosphatase n=1 Tax=Photobacterium makurazakiensis TaxID=2910234 RepID=UPI003D10ED79
MHYSVNNGNVNFSLPKSMNSLYLVGTFTNWQVQDSFKLELVNERLMLSKPFSEFNKIGNSGYVEYVIWDETLCSPLPFDNSTPQGHYFNNQFNQGYNYLLFPIHPSKLQCEKISKVSKQSFKIKNTSESFSSKEQLANFRPVLGGTLKRGCIFRSYHPVVQSCASHLQLQAIEIKRQAAVMALIEKHRIHTVINLSDSRQTLERFMPKLPSSYYKTCWDEQRIHSLPVAYETVYFMSDRNENFNDEELGFQDGIRRLITLIANHKGPYLVHCRLGSDRTGVMSAFLQLFMGASKAEVKDSYLITNELGIGEYRSFRLLEYALQACLGLDCFESGKQSVNTYLMKLGISKAVCRQAEINLSR